MNRIVCSPSWLRAVLADGSGHSLYRYDERGPRDRQVAQFFFAAVVHPKKAAERQE
jgi:hypothetical protein